MSSQTAVEAVQELMRSGVLPEILQTQAKILGGFLSVLWVLELADTLLFRGAFNRFGIRPRQAIGLRGIVLAPLLHGSLRHLAANTAPLLVLGWFTMLRSLSDFWVVTAVVWLVSGLGVWLFASRRSNHIGASGLVFGYFGFLLTRGYFERSVGAIAISVVVVLLYGSLFWGVLPIRRGMSWQGHLFGFGGGILAARYLPQLQQWLAGLGQP